MSVLLPLPLLLLLLILLLLLLQLLPLLLLLMAQHLQRTAQLFLFFASWSRFASSLFASSLAV